MNSIEESTSARRIDFAGEKQVHDLVETFEDCARTIEGRQLEWIARLMGPVFRLVKACVVVAIG